MQAELGATYRDSVSGISGVATSATTYLFGCERVCIEWKDGDGHLQSEVFDFPSLIFVRPPSDDVLNRMQAIRTGSVMAPGASPG